jgi:hypothetical protein
VPLQRNAPPRMSAPVWPELRSDGTVARDASPVVVLSFAGGPFLRLPGPNLRNLGGPSPPSAGAARQSHRATHRRDGGQSSSLVAPRSPLCPRELSARRIVGTDPEPGEARAELRLTRRCRTGGGPRPAGPACAAPGSDRRPASARRSRAEYQDLALQIEVHLAARAEPIEQVVRVILGQAPARTPPRPGRG